MQPLVIHNRYVVVRKFASGGMGDIFLAHQTGMADIKRLVIVKTLRAPFAADPSFLEQFLDEARVAATLNHPNIVGIYEVGEHQGMHFIAMEYIAGVDLSALMRSALQRERTIPWRVAATIIKEAAMGLDAAHTARDEAGRPLSVVHRDVSPQNIMVRPDGIVKVVDFGVALATTRQHETQANLIKGKVRYMSPEHICGRPLDGRADQFGLGVVLWELCAGRPLFETNNPIEVYELTMQGKLPHLIDVAPTTPPALSAIVERTLKSAREERFPRCADFAHALRRLLEDAGGDAAREASAFVEDMAGAVIAERVRDLTPQPVVLHGGSEVACPACGHTQAAALRFCGACGAPTPQRESATRAENRVRARGAEPQQEEPSTRVLPSPPAEGLSVSVALPREPMEPIDPIELSLSFALSRVVPQDTCDLVVVAAEVPSWSELVRDVESEPMGAFSARKLTRTLLRQLETLAAAHNGAFVVKTPQRSVVAFGLEGARTDHPGRALRFAMDWQTALNDFARPPQRMLRLHGGIARGMCHVSDVPGAPLVVTGACVDEALALAEEGRVAGRGVLIAHALASELAAHASLLPTESKSQAWEVTTASQASHKVDPALRSHRRVLVVDDSGVFRRVQKEALRKFDCTTIEASDGEAALRLAIESIPDLILLDMHMPKMDGIAVLTALRDHAATRHIPVVVVSTVSRSVERAQLDALGVRAYVDKPVQPAALVAAVRTIFESDSPPAI